MEKRIYNERTGISYTYKAIIICLILHSPNKKISLSACGDNDI